MIDVHRLAVLRAVAKGGSFAAAAAELRHTPSAVSQQISALERSVGIPLVQRSTRGATLTEAGRVLVASADAIHAELRAVEGRLHSMQEQGPGALRIATFPSAGEPLLVPALTMLAEPNRPVDVFVVEASPEPALQLARAGEVDLALVYHFHTRTPPRHWLPPAGPGTLTHLMDDPLRLLVPATHPLANRSKVSMSELAGEHWIQGTFDTGGPLDALGAAAGYRPHVVCRTSDYRFMTALVAAGVGVALLPHLALTGHPGAVDISLAENPVRFLSAFLPRRTWTNPAADLLLTQLRLQAARLTRSPPSPVAGT